MANKKGAQVVNKNETKKSYKIIKEQEENDLLVFIDDMPTKFGLPLLRFFDGLEKVTK